MIERRYAWRVATVTAVVLAAWVGLGARLAFLHLGPNENLRARVESIRYLEKKMVGQRGRILDREGNILALDLTVKTVCVNPKQVLEGGRAEIVGGYLAHMLDLPPAMVFARINRPDDPYEPVKRKVNEDLAQRISRMQLDGVFFEDDTGRNYPLGAIMSHVVGFSNVQGVGSAGVELQMDKYLKGRAGLRVGEQDGKGREVYIRRDLEIAPQPGADVYLTIDQNLQYIVEKALDLAMEEHSAKGAWAIIQRVGTGEVLAMACRPDYDLNDFRHAPAESIRNRAVGYVYEPGSTLKGPVLAAALNEGVVTPEDIFDCEDGFWVYAGKGLRDYHGHGLLSVADVLKKSSNIGMAKIAIELGEKRLANYLHLFGLGAKTGIDLPGEEAGILHPLSEWSKISITRLPMGHEVAVTALQILNAYCCIANNGFLMQPYLVQRVVDANGYTVLSAEPKVISRPIRQETARLMQKLLSRVTEDGGTARRARVDGYSVAGKTGTAQKPIPGGYSHEDHMASFVGFLPAEQPELGIVVVVDEPQPKHTGGVVAAPVFREIAEQAVRYLDIPPFQVENPILVSRAL